MLLHRARLRAPRSKGTSMAESHDHVRCTEVVELVCSTERAGAVAAATGLVKSGLFAGQSQQFFDAVTALATAADAAERSV